MPIITPLPLPVPLYPVWGPLTMPIYGWRIWRSPNQSLSSDTEAASFANVNDVQLVCWYHLKPYRTLTYGLDVYDLPDGTTRLSGAQMSDPAYKQLVDKVFAETLADWPILRF